MTAANVKFDLVALWVQIWGAPFDMSSPKVAAEIGGRLGEVVEIERRQKLDAQNLFMRVKVAVPTLKPLRRGGFIGGLDGKSSWVLFKYKRLPLFCHFCGLLGHDLKHCAKHFALSKNGARWLKSAGGRSRSPLRMGLAKNHHPSNEDLIEVQTENRSSQVRLAAEDVSNGANPTDGDLHAKGKDGKVGISPVCTDVVFVMDGISTEILGPFSSVSKSKEICIGDSTRHRFDWVKTSQHSNGVESSSLQR